MKKQHGNIIIETIQMGNCLKVSAIDVRTGTEVSIVADPKAPRKERERIAIRKLERILNTRD